MRPSDDALSLHGQPSNRYLDDDAPELQVDDLPPLYDDIAGPENGEGSSAPLLPNFATSDQFPGMIPYHTKDTATTCYVDERLDNDPKLLEQHVNWWAQTPPRPFVRLLGTHWHDVDRNGKKERESVTDFDVQVELTPYLFSDAANRVASSELRTPENTDKVCRGTLFATRAPGAKQNIELGLPDKPTLTEWCHRYHASHAGLKTFSVVRRMVGFDEDKVREKLEALIRHSNYRGNLQISFPVQDQLIKVYNDCRTNRWRLTKWIYFLCIFTLMFLFTWPYLFFRTKRFEVVAVDWHFSQFDLSGRKKYTTVSEDQWYNLWARAINHAVLERRQGVLDQQDLLAAEGAPPAFLNVEGARDILRAGISAMNAVNSRLGWGGDC